MAKLLHILAASVGGGIVLGASIRLGEGLGGSYRATMKSRGAGKKHEDAQTTREPRVSEKDAVTDRLERLEERLSRAQQCEPAPATEATYPSRQQAATVTNTPQSTGANTRSATFAPRAARPPSAPMVSPKALDSEWRSALTEVVARMDRQQNEVEKLRQQVASSTYAVESVVNLADDLRDSLHRQISGDLEHRLAAIEEQFHLSMKAANKETVNTIVASIETRVSPRISQLESNMGAQTAAVAELRDCSMQSERNILRLLTALERLSNPQGQKPATSGISGEAEGQVPDVPRLSVISRTSAG